MFAVTLNLLLFILKPPLARLLIHVIGSN